MTEVNVKVRLISCALPPLTPLTHPTHPLTCPDKPWFPQISHVRYVYGSERCLILRSTSQPTALGFSAPTVFDPTGPSSCIVCVAQVAQKWHALFLLVPPSSQALTFATNSRRCAEGRTDHAEDERAESVTRDPREKRETKIAQGVGTKGCRGGARAWGAGVRRTISR